jgi:hypothetical protein
MTRNAHGSRHGGHLADIPLPHIRKYPGNEGPRPVEVSVAQYAGFPHWHVTINESSNPIWDEATEYWTTAWDDRSEETRGRIFHQQCQTQGEAKNWIALIISTEFNNGEGYAFNFTDDEWRPPFIIVKEGD